MNQEEPGGGACERCVGGRGEVDRLVCICVRGVIVRAYCIKCIHSHHQALNPSVRKPLTPHPTSQLTVSTPT